jgi:hypothetical protein
MSRWWRAWLVAAAVGANASCAAGAQDGDPVAAELARLEASAAQLAERTPQGLSDALGRAREGLAAVRAARDPRLALYRLREPLVTLETVAYVVGHGDAAADLPRLEAAWKGEGGAAAPAPPATGSRLHLALWQAAANKAEKLHAAAMPYGRAAGPSAGLYYLGEAVAHRRFRDLVARAAPPASPDATAEPAVDAAALEGALVELEEATVAAFARDPAAPTMVAVSARLKEARELFEAKALAGAALTTLEARLALSRRLADPAAFGAPATGSAAPPPGDGAAPAAAPILGSDGGSSLRALFLAAAAEDPAPGTASLVRDDVLPLHDRLLRSRR